MIAVSQKLLAIIEKVFIHIGKHQNFDLPYRMDFLKVRWFLF